jgi:5-methylcytosine-specific restriction endonuclease McrA
MTQTSTALKERSPQSLRTLILNADGMPLSTWPLNLISAQDAVTSAWLGKAIVVEEWPGAFFHSPTTTVAVPKTMMLREYAHVGQSPKFCRRSILLRDRFTCQYCGQPFPEGELTYDHVIPRSLGGETRWENIVSACVECNKAKRDALPRWSARKGSGLRPLKPPRQPSTAELLRAGLELLPNDVREDWGSWLYHGVELER